MSKHSDISEFTEPELHHLGFRRYLPNRLLQPWIQCYWSVKKSLPLESSFSESQYPDGGSSLDFHFNNNQLVNSELQLTHTVQKVAFSGEINSIGIRFKPGGAFKLLGIPINELGHAHYDAQVMDFHSFQRLEDRLSKKIQTISRIIEIEAWLMEQFIRSQTQSEILQALLAKISFKQINLSDWLISNGINRRKLERIFKEEVGISPSHLIKLNKVKLARKLIKSNPNLPLTVIAQRCGFYDQSHFTHNFHRYTDQIPSAYRKKKLSQIYN